MRKAKWTITLMLALIFAMSATAMAAPAAAPIQTPLSPAKIPQFVNQLDQLLAGIPVVINPDLTPKTTVDLSICEFQTQILPAGTPIVPLATPGAIPGLTYVWGYQEGLACNPNPGHSYLGPAVIAGRGTPTTMNFYNRLPDANMSSVKAYATSTDQTLIWGDPVGLDAYPPTGIPASPYTFGTPELNMCWNAAQKLVPPALMPAACNNNYGFIGPQVLPIPPLVPAYSAPTPAAVHIHGGEVPSVLDGGPDAWWTPNGIYGHGYYSQGGTGDAALGKATYVYPNVQEAAPVWFHDHMLGATRLNVYAGIAGAYPIIEPPSTLAPGLHPLGLADATWTPVGKFKPDGVTPADENDRPFTSLVVPLIIQDRMFDTNGQLFFPNVGINPEHPFWVPEFVGDVICVNGKAWPNLNVQPKRYKFLFLNGSNARSYELFFPKGGPAIYVIGNDQGYLDAPALATPKLTMMPGERYEVIIDFAASAGKKLILQNSARTPWVGGAPVNGQTTGRIMQFTVAPGAVVDTSFNPVTATFVRAKYDPNAIPPGYVANPMNRLTVAGGTTPDPRVTIHKYRRLTLNEVIAAGGPLEILVNNTLYDGSKPRPPYTDPITGLSDFTPVTSIWNTSYYSELPHEGETELWEIVNLTADAHPMHPHLVAFQVLNRQALDVKGYLAAYNLAYGAVGLPIDGAGPPQDYSCGLRWDNPTTPDPTDTWAVPPRGAIAPTTCFFGGNPDPAVTLSLIGLPVPPSAQEVGWKDTVQALPNMVTRILVRFAPPTVPLCNTDAAGNCLAPPLKDNADTIGYEFSPNGGHGYVWHCHIVDHEDNEMMRPYTVQANPGFIHTYVMGTHY